MTWKTTSASIAAAALAGGLGGWKLKPDPTPAVDLHTSSGYQGAETDAVKVVEKQGPVRIVHKWRVMPGPGCSSPAEEHEETTDKGPAAIASSSTRSSSTSLEQKSDVKVTPAPRPSWALYGAWKLDTKEPVAGVDVRVLRTPIWVSVRTEPKRLVEQLLQLKAPPLELGGRVEF